MNSIDDIIKMKAFSGRTQGLSNIEMLNKVRKYMGETIFDGHNSVRPFARITERAGKRVDIPDGCVSDDGNVMGTYIHGIFDNDEFRSKLMNYLRSKKGLEPSHEFQPGFKSIKERRYDGLASIVRENMDVNIVYDILK
ncbi:MAG: hypothetical protein L3J18_17760 [Candidatus Brocadia sp.]|uniref:Cobyric acid synthase CobQ n=1 Tax=Candidatus Brocadia fulgida TaxID=380242 RepID=A0A0M2UX65_9BACT|nr:MAG: cobyric acid synthase CobQ [Candidatus Brocadia fulgida]OQZ00227.1 MAG: hypothetical protein B6D35_07245 [Candidatus Brocadia sp. UTAMX2]UJS20706.1 MAG: hypothetical protein L3J18_17760 [Candidatus Brocadia sp.]